MGLSKALIIHRRAGEFKSGPCLHSRAPLRGESRPQRPRAVENRDSINPAPRPRGRNIGRTAKSRGESPFHQSCAPARPHTCATRQGPGHRAGASRFSHNAMGGRRLRNGQLPGVLRRSPRVASILRPSPRDGGARLGPTRQSLPERMAGSQRLLLCRLKSSFSRPYRFILWWRDRGSMPARCAVSAIPPPVSRRSAAR